MDDVKKRMLLFTSILIGVLIMFTPNMITGYSYDVSRVMGSILIVEFIVRTLALIIGLFVIYDGAKNYLLK